MDVDKILALQAEENEKLRGHVNELAAEVARLRIELDWRQGDTNTESARRARDNERTADVVQAWRELTEANPDARTLGGALSHKLWTALDELAPPATDGGA